MAAESLLSEAHALNVGAVQVTDGVGIAPRIPRTNTFMSRKGPKEQSLRATGKSDSEREARGSQDSPRALRCGKEQGPQPSPLWVACKRACSQVYARCEYYFRHLDVETGRRQPTARVAGTTSSRKKQRRHGAKFISPDSDLQREGAPPP